MKVTYVGFTINLLEAIKFNGKRSLFGTDHR